MEKKMWTKEEIRERMKTSDKWVVRGILAIYNLQTADEQKVEATTHNNGVGFNGVDAPFLSSLAQQILNGRTLTEKQINAARKAMLKYSGQLTLIANG